MTEAPVRVAICANSRAYAAGLRHFLETDRELEVVTVASSGEQLLGELARVRPELITMDLELPGIDSVEAIRRIMATAPTPIVVISTRTAESADGLVSAALDEGALEALRKGEVRLDRRLSPRATALRRHLTGLVRGTPGDASAPNGGAPRLPRRSVATIVGIAASAGGPAALGEVLGELPADFGLPVLVVQHISEGFADNLAGWLDSAIALPVRLARDGETPGPGVLIAPDNAHLLLEASGRLRLDRATDHGRHRPSADALLTSMAQAAGRGVVAVVLSGMGRDGAAGIAAVRAAGGVALTERSEHARLPSMPLAAAQEGATPLERPEIGRILAALSPSAVR